MSDKKDRFYNLHEGYLTLEEVVESVFSYFAQKPDKKYRLIVGSDSSSEDRPTFPVVIVVLREGEGGRFFVRKFRYPKEKIFSTLQQRILQEVYLSCETALDLKEKIKAREAEKETNYDYQFRYIHADVGEAGPTKDMIHEVVSLINSNGFEAKIKPSSYAASIVADRYT